MLAVHSGYSTVCAWASALLAVERTLSRHPKLYTKLAMTTTGARDDYMHTYPSNTIRKV